jgi:cytochrome c1
VRRLFSAASLLLALAAGGCAPKAAAPQWADFGGDPRRGEVLIVRAGCGSCHVIPGVQSADGLVGPPLTHFSQRTMVAGLLPNTPQGLVNWLRHPQAIVPGNGMPDVGLSDAEARDIAAYLYTIR